MTYRQQEALSNHSVCLISCDIPNLGQTKQQVRSIALRLFGLFIDMQFAGANQQLLCTWIDSNHRLRSPYANVPVYVHIYGKFTLVLYLCHILRQYIQQDNCNDGVHEGANYSFVWYLFNMVIYFWQWNQGFLKSTLGTVKPYSH